MRSINKTGLCEGCGVVLTAKDKRTRFCSISCAHSGERNVNWKGDNVGIDALHTFIKSRLPSFTTSLGFFKIRFRPDIFILGLFYFVYFLYI